MKVLILAGGLGTRLSEETSVRPKPMVEVGGIPIMVHIMRHYAKHGHKEFVILCGYKGEVIRDYFLNFHRHASDFTIDLGTGDVTTLRKSDVDWKVTLLDTGADSLTGGRIRRARDIVGDETFCLTYGDGVSNVDINAIIDHHKKTQAWATLTAVTPPGRYGILGLDADGRVNAFREKHAKDVGSINGGFFVCEPKVFDLIEGDHTTWEAEPLNELVDLGKLAAYRHTGFWQSMDTLRDKMYLEKLWTSDSPPWLEPAPTAQTQPAE